MMRVTLHINADQIGDYEIRNTGETWPGECRYEVRPIEDSKTGELIGSVHHYVAQGAEALASTAMALVSQRSKRVRP